MGVTDYVANVLRDNPVAYWRLNEPSGFPKDSSPNGNNMTVKAVAAGHYQQLGPFGTPGIRFTSTELFRRAQVSTATNNFTLELWVNWLVKSTTLSQNKIVMNSDAPEGVGWMFVQSIDDFDNFRIDNLGSGFYQADSVAVCAVGVWNQIVIVYDNNVWKYYFNGVLDTANANFGPASVTGGMTRTVVGNTAGGEDMDLVLAHVSMYDSVLSPGRISDHYTAAFSFEPSDKRARLRSRRTSW